MRGDARNRLLELANDPRGPRTEKARIRALLPEIEAARAAGRTWTEIGDALGVARSTLFAAVKVKEAASTKAALIVPANLAEAAKLPEEQEARPAAEPGPMKSKIKRWGE